MFKSQGGACPPLNHPEGGTRPLCPPPCLRHCTQCLNLKMVTIVDYFFSLEPSIYLFLLPFLRYTLRDMIWMFLPPLLIFLKTIKKKLMPPLSDTPVFSSRARWIVGSSQGSLQDLRMISGLRQVISDEEKWNEDHLFSNVTWFLFERRMRRDTWGHGGGHVETRQFCFG